MTDAHTDRTSTVHPGVTFGSGSTVMEFCVIGVPVKNADSAVTRTYFGADAVIRSHTVIYAGSQIGARFQTGHGVLVREFCEIRDDVSVGSHSVLEHRVKLGKGVRIHSNVFVPEFTVVEDGAWIGPNVVFTNATYPASPDAKANLRGPIIRAGAKIGANATILPGIEIGANALVGAGSVVVNDVPAGKVVVGNPARIVRDIADVPAYAAQSR